MTTTIAIDPSRFRLLHRHAEPKPIGTTLICEEGQCAVFLQWGRVAGSLGPGRHLLDPQQIPFLSLLLEGGSLGGELLIVNTRGASLAVPLADEQLNVIVRVSDPARMLAELAGPADPAAIERFVIDQLKAALGSAPADFAALGAARDKLAPMGFEVVRLESGTDAGPKRSATQAMTAQEAADVLAASASAAPAPVAAGGSSTGVGARVRMTHAGAWYSGTVAASKDDQCEIEWDSGHKSWVPLGGLEPEPAYPGAHPAGTRVLAEWSDGGFYPATVRHFNGTSYQVAWENGTSAWLSPGQIKLA